MTTSTLPHHAGSAQATPHAVQAVREFLIAWFQATPVYLVYRALNH